MSSYDDFVKRQLYGVDGTSRPHIVMHSSSYWECIGSDSHGAGKTPDEAFKNWRLYRLMCSQGQAESTLKIMMDEIDRLNGLIKKVQDFTYVPTASDPLAMGPLRGEDLQ